MELDITDFFNNAAPMDYSASIAEIGNNAGQDTWNAAVEDSSDYQLLDTEDKLEAFRVFVLSSGGWNEEEIASWSDTELNALCIQWISGDIREADLDKFPRDWNRYYILANDGNVSSRLYASDDETRVYWNFSE